MIHHHLVPTLTIKDFKPIQRTHNQRLALTIEQLATLVSCPMDYFEQFYVTSLFRLAQLTQQLPDLENPKKAYIDAALERAYLVLAKRRGRLLPIGSPTETVAHQDAIWTFALFSAALCHGLGRSLLSVEVSLARQSGHKPVDLSIWSPFKGCFPNSATHYRWEVRDCVDDQLCLSLNRELIRYLFCEDSLRWLSQFPDVKQHWFAFISGEASENNPLFALIGGEYRPAKKPKAKPTPALKLITSTEKPKSADKPTPEPEQTVSPFQSFLPWLNQQITQQRISCNVVNAGVYQLNKGVFVQSTVLEAFLTDKKGGKLTNFMRYLEKEPCLIMIAGQALVRFMDLACLNPTAMQGVLIKHAAIEAMKSFPFYELLACEYY